MAIGYMMNENGTYANTARNLLSRAMERYVQGLAGSNRERFEKILETVRAGGARFENYPEQLSYNVTDDIYHHLIAIGFLNGTGGEYAAPARLLLTQEAQEFINELDDKGRKDFAMILESVKIGREHSK